MHIHGNPMNLNLAHLPSAGAANNAAATERAAEVRKNLLQPTDRVAEDFDSDAVSMVGHWTDDASQNRQPPEHADPRTRQSANHQAASSQPIDKDAKDAANHPISFWA